MNKDECDFEQHSVVEYNNTVYDANIEHSCQQFDDVSETVRAAYGTGGNNMPLVLNRYNKENDNLDMKNEDSVSMEDISKYVVRRLTPTECNRLQGFPEIKNEDGSITSWVDIGDWTDTSGKVHKDADSTKYKALGNSIALPFWDWLAHRISQQYEEDYQPTMCSLFDGISGFPLVFVKAGVNPIWTSEIEEFPIAVCKKHFGDEDSGEVGDLDKYVNNVTYVPIYESKYKSEE